MNVESDTEMEEQTTSAEAEAIVLSQLENLRRELRRFSDHHVWGKRAIEAAYEVARKLVPDLVDAGEKYLEGNKSDTSRALQETAELRTTVNDLVKAVGHLVKRQEAEQTKEGKYQNQPPLTQGARTVVATGPTYRPVKANPATTKNTTPTQRQQYSPRSPRDQYHPARLIIVPRGSKIDTEDLNPRRLVNLINDRLAQSENAKHLRVASAQYNHNQNLIIMMREDQKGEELRQHAREFIDILGIPEHTVDMLTDDRRYKVRINGVWTGRDGEGGYNTPDDLKEELERFNPIMSRVSLIGKPRWMRAETDIQKKEHSSIVLEFAKEDDAQTMLNAKYIAMYTNFCEVVHHADRPPVLQCSKCWAIGHHISRCKYAMRCRLCAGEHNEKDHDKVVDSHMAEEGEEGEGSDGQRNRGGNRCVNCGGDHPATERNCPERRRSQMIARERDHAIIEGGATIKKRKPLRRKENGPNATGANRAEGNAKSQTTTSLNQRPGDEKRNANSSMSLENLLNHGAGEEEEQMEIVTDEETERRNPGNVPTI